MLDANVLVLNRNWQPIHITTVRRAFTLLYMGAAHVIHNRGASPFATETRGASPFATETRGASPFATETRGASPAATETRGASPAATETRGASPAATGPDFGVFDFDSWAALSLGPPDAIPVIRTVSRALRVPQVIMLQLYDRVPRAHVRFSRLNIYLRDDNRCQYCGLQADRAQLNLDHVVPRSRGGRTTWENVVCCCLPCNLRKGARTPQEAGMRLIKRPQKPSWTPTMRPRGHTPREWLPFLGTTDASYWNTELLDEGDEARPARAARPPPSSGRE